MMTNKSREAAAFRDYLNDEEELELRELIRACNENDGTTYSFPEEADCYGLMYSEGRPCAAIALFGMGVSSGGRAVDEIAAWTRPEYRQRGFFKRLYGELRELYEVAEVNRFAVYENPSATETLRRISAEHIYDECIMRLRLNSEEDVYADEEKYDSSYSILEEMSISEEGICECRYGSCAYKLYGAEAYIYGVLIYDSFRSKGYGFKMMYSLIKALRKKQAASCFLEVSSLNIPAAALYQKMGFKVEERIKYYEKTCNLE